MDITGEDKQYGAGDGGRGDCVVLVVNDDPLVRGQMCLLLEEAGYTVAHALDGFEALELAGRMSPEIVISDVNMPNMDGIELCRCLRRDERFSGVPILLVSAERKDSWSAEAGMRAGADDYIEIPFDDFRFMAKVMRHIARHQSEKELRLANAELEERVRERMVELALMNAALCAQVADFQQAEQELRESESRFKSLFDDAPMAYHELDSAGRITRVNQTWQRLFGYEAAEVEGRPIWEFVAESASRELVMQKLSGDSPLHSYERTFLHRDGTRVPVLLEDRLIRDGEGWVIGIRTTLLDATERKLAEAELRRSENALRMAHEDNERLLGVLPSIIIGIDGDGCVTRINRVAATTLGICEEEVVGKPVDDCGINWDSELLFQIISDSMAQVSISRLPDIKYTRRDGREGVLGLTTIPFEAAASSKFGMLLYGVDITERRKLEGQFRQAQKLESIGQLAAGIAHEINTPTQYVGDNCRFLRDAFSDLTDVLRSYAELAEAAKSGAVSDSLHATVDGAVAAADLDYLVEEVPRAINQALEGVGRIAEIVRSMKEFAHPGTAERRAADLNRAIESTVTVARNEWKYVAEVALDLDATLPAVPCMVGEINQVVLNLMVNASHAVADKVGDGSRGKGQITVATRREGDWAVVQVSDSGVGIPERLRGRIFDPFFTTKEVGKGTGQGLAIAHGVIVEKHGGEIGFETEEGVGTTFTIRLPLTEVSRESSREEVLVA